MRAGNATVLNLTVKFGRKNLSDYWEEYVVPAFFKELTRKYGNTRYVFVGVERSTIELDGKRLDSIYGQFVKDTVLKSEQVLIDDELVEQQASISSAPSATFVVTLDPHRLIFMADTSYAPTEKQFASTLESFIRKIRSADVLRRYEEALERSQDGERISKASIEREIPKPEVRVEPIPSDSTISEFVRGFEKIQSLRFKILQPNDELNPVETFQGLTDASEEVGAPANLSFRNNEGLDKDAAVEIIEGAVEQGVNQVVAKGISQDGDDIQKSNEDLKVVKSLHVVRDQLRARARDLIRLFRENF